MTVRILIADDHPLVRDGLRMILEAQEDFKVVGEAFNGREAISRAAALRPDVIIMDIAMPELNGIEASHSICGLLPDVKILILSMHYSTELCFRALQSGAQGYILKESAGEEVVAAVYSVVRGRRYFGTGVTDPFETHGVDCHKRLKSPLESLSHREHEIFQLVVEGKSSTEIAALLSLSPKSIDTYRSRLMHKLGITSLPSLVSFALQHGITPIK